MRSDANRLIGIVGPMVGDMRLQRIGIAGYGVGLPITCLILARVFRQDGSNEAH